MISSKDLDGEDKSSEPMIVFNVTPMDIDDDVDFLIVNFGTSEFMVSGNHAQNIIDKFKEFLIRHEIDVPVFAMPFYMNIKAMHIREKEKLLDVLKTSVSELEKSLIEHEEEEE